MTAPLDENGLEAAIDVACRNAGHDPNACMFGSGGTSVGSECHVTYREAHRAGTAQVIRAYLSAVALPDELEVVAWDFSEIEHILDETFHFASASPGAQENINHVLDILRREPLVTISQANSTIAALRAERDEAQQELKAHELSFDLRYKSDMRACKRWQEATGRTMTLPDHTDLSIWLFAQLETAEAEVKRLTEANEALRADAARYAYLRDRDLDTIHNGGVFAGSTPENVVLNGADLDQYIDDALAQAGGLNAPS